MIFPYSKLNSSQNMDSLSSCCATITHRKCLESHDFVPILFFKKSGEDPDRLRITLVFLHKIFENLINTKIAKK